MSKKTDQLMADMQQMADKLQELRAKMKDGAGQRATARKRIASLAGDAALDVAGAGDALLDAQADLEILEAEQRHWPAAEKELAARLESVRNELFESQLVDADARLAQLVKTDAAIRADLERTVAGLLTMAQGWQEHLAAKRAAAADIERLLNALGRRRSSIDIGDRSVPDLAAKALELAKPAAQPVPQRRGPAVVLPAAVSSRRFEI